MTKKLYVYVEREDFSTFTQEIEWDSNHENIIDAIRRYENILGSGYRIYGFRISNGEQR